MVLPYINMNLPRVYTCSPSWTPLPPPSPYHPSGSSQCTSPKHPASCIEPDCWFVSWLFTWLPSSHCFPTFTWKGWGTTHCPAEKDIQINGKGINHLLREQSKKYWSVLFNFSERSSTITHLLTRYQSLNHQEVGGRFMREGIYVCMCVCVYMYISDSAFCTAEMNTTLQNNWTSIKKILNRKTKSLPSNWTWLSHDSSFIPVFCKVNKWVQTHYPLMYDSLFLSATPAPIGRPCLPRVIMLSSLGTSSLLCECSVKFQIQ